MTNELNIEHCKRFQCASSPHADREKSVAQIRGFIPMRSPYPVPRLWLVLRAEDFGFPVRSKAHRAYRVIHWPPFGNWRRSVRGQAEWLVGKERPPRIAADLVSVACSGKAGRRSVQRWQRTAAPHARKTSAGTGHPSNSDRQPAPPGPRADGIVQ